MPLVIKPPATTSLEGYRTGLFDSLGTTLDYLGRPQNALAGMLDFNNETKFLDRAYKGLTGKEDYDYVENPYANFILEAVVDPVNAIPLGMLSKAGKTDLGLGGQGTESAGRFMSSFSNYIDNFYGKAKGAVNTPSEIQLGQKLIKAGEKLKNIPYFGKKYIKDKLPGPDLMRNPKLMQQAQANLGAKAFGFWKNLKEGTISGIKSEFDPIARALYSEKGINLNAQKMVKEFLEAGDDVARAIPKAVAQVIYNAHIAVQAGKKGGFDALDPSIKGVLEKSFVRGYETYTPGSFSSMFKKHPALKNNRKMNITDREADILENHIIDQQGVPDLTVMKSSNIFSGNHIYDLTSQRNLNIQLIKSTFANNKKFNNVEELKSALEISQKEIRTKQSKELMSKDIVILDKFNDPDNPLYDPTGIWIFTSHPGQAIVEGGANYLMKIKPKGEFLAVMSDRHDFFEAVTDSKLNSLVAVSSIVRGNAKHLNLPKKARDAAKGQYTTAKATGKISTDNDEVYKQFKDKFEKVVNEYVSVKPSKEAVDLEKERLRNVGAAVGGGLTLGAVNNPRSEEQQ